MLRHIPARSEQTSLPNSLTKIHAGDRVRSVHAGRIGIAVKVYVDGSAAVSWDDGDPQPEGLAHERMPRALLELHDQASPDRAEQTASVRQIVADALRTAALAPTLSDALDVAGAALNEIATISRGELPVARASVDEDSLALVHQVANETLNVFDRVGSLLEAIERLTVDSDDAIADLASIGRGLVASQTERLDNAFTSMRHHAHKAGVSHG